MEGNGQRASETADQPQQQNGQDGEQDNHHQEQNPRSGQQDERTPDLDAELGGEAQESATQNAQVANILQTLQIFVTLLTQLPEDEARLLLNLYRRGRANADNSELGISDESDLQDILEQIGRTLDEFANEERRV